MAMDMSSTEISQRRSQFAAKRSTSCSLPRSSTAQGGPAAFCSPRRRSNIVYDNSELTLKDFLSRHSNSFPVQFTIVKGFQNDALSMSEGDTYTAYFEKRTDVIAMVDFKGEECSLPVNSAMQLGLIYDPNKYLDEALIGYEFETAGEVIKASMKPTLLKATLAHKDNKDSRSVERDELLLVKQCVHSRFKEYVEVYSITLGVTKKLKGSCRGRFTTNPHRVAMYAGELLKHVPNISGVQALMISDTLAAFYSSQPQQFVSEPVTLLRSGTESSLIARPPQDGDQTYRLVEIPSTLDITVRVVPPNSAGRSTTSKRDTFQAVEAYKFRRIKTIDKSLKQRAFREAVRPGFEDTGVSLQMPPKEEIYESIDEVDNVALKRKQRTQSLQENSDQYKPLTGADRGIKLVGVSDEYVTMQREQDAHSRDSLPQVAVAPIDNCNGPLQNPFDSEEPQKRLDGSSTIAGFPCAQVLDLLDKMKLSQYKEKFEQEKITGKLLLACDEHVLESDLGVASKLHRIRLMQLIRGETSLDEAMN